MYKQKWWWWWWWWWGAYFGECLERGGAGSSWSCILTLLFHNKCLSYLPHSIFFPNTASHAKISHRQRILENPTCQILVNSHCLILNSQFPFWNIHFFGFILLFTSSLPCSKDQFAMSYFSTSLIVLIQVYNWEIRHHSLVCCCGLADIFYQFPYPVKKFPTLYFGQIPDPKNTPPDPVG